MPLALVRVKQIRIHREFRVFKWAAQLKKNSRKDTCRVTLTLGTATALSDKVQNTHEKAGVAACGRKQTR